MPSFKFSGPSVKGPSASGQISWPWSKKKRKGKKKKRGLFRR
jgi:hypothetical protein